MSNVRSLHDGFRDYHSWATDPTPRIPFGINFVDGKTNGGIGRSELALLMAFSSVGKTTIGLNIIRNNPGIPVLFMSLEMSWRMVAARIAAMECGITTKKIENDYRTGGGTPPYVQPVVDKYRSLVCDDTPAITIKEAKESFHRATDMLGIPPRLVIWDYMELVGGAGMMGKAEQVDRAAEKLRNFSREMDCANLVLHQVGKGDAGGGAEPLDLGSGRYGGHAPADYVLGAYAPRLEKGISQAQFRSVEDEIFIQLLKNRAGQAHPVGVRHRLDHQTMRLTDWNSLPDTSYYAQQVTIEEEEFA